MKRFHTRGSEQSDRNGEHMAGKRKKFEVPGQQVQGVRINKYLSDAGICSRREADSYITQGKVTIDGAVAENGSRVFPGQSVVFLGQPVYRQEEQILIAFYKPVGIVCTTDTREPDNVIDYLNYGKRIYPIGRLDKESEGLLLLTNDGDIVNKILRAGNHHEKEYQVTVNNPVTPEFLKGMAVGVPILDTVTKPCRLEQTGKSSFTIILTQGLNRQIRRMCEYFGYRVVSLKRVRIMHIRLGRLKEGTYRNLTGEELKELEAVLKNSSALPAASKNSPVRQAAKQGAQAVEETKNRGTKRRQIKAEEGTGTGHGRKNGTGMQGKNRRTGRTAQ